jgi:hypothetical protein
MRLPNGRLPAGEWFDGLNKKGRGRFYAAAKLIQNTLRSGRPPVGRAVKVMGSKTGLWELRVTPDGSTPPHLRLLYLRRGQTLWAAIGFTKQKNELQEKDRKTGDRIAIEWMKGGETP